MIAQRIVLVVGSVLALAIVTLGPLGLRPETGLPHQVERGLMYLLLGALIALALRPRWVMAALLIIAIAALLELLQFLVPGRDARLLDFFSKATGGSAGVALAMVSEQLFTRRRGSGSANELDAPAIPPRDRA